MKLSRPRESFRAGDRVFAVVQNPDVALLLTCDGPASWTAIVFDFARKQAVATARNQPSCSEAQKYAVEQMEVLYNVAAPEIEIQWRQALNRPDILQT